MIDNVKIYDLKESIMAAAYPMRTEIIDYGRELDEKDLKRVINLIRAVDNDNQAHGQFLSGIRVAFDVSATNKWYVEAERYRFLSFVSSESTMHLCFCTFSESPFCGSQWQRAANHFSLGAI